MQTDARSAYDILESSLSDHYRGKSQPVLGWSLLFWPNIITTNYTNKDIFSVAYNKML